MSGCRRISTLLLAFSVKLGVLVGCNPTWLGEPAWFGQGIIVRNETDVELTFQAIDDGEMVQLPARADPGDSIILIGAQALATAPSRFGADGCASVSFAAFDPDGDEVARIEPPLCLDDEWVVRDER